MVRKTDDCDVTHYLYVCTKAGGTQNAILNWPDEKKVIFEEEGFDSDYEDTFSQKDEKKPESEEGSQKSNNEENEDNNNDADQENLAQDEN